MYGYKGDLFGVGYDPAVENPEFNAYRSNGRSRNGQGVYSMNAVKDHSGDDRMSRGMTGFALNDDEDDVYDNGSSSTQMYGSFSRYIYMHIYIYKYIYIYIFMYIYIFIDMYISIYVYTYVHIYTYIHIHSYIFMYIRIHIYRNRDDLEDVDSDDDFGKKGSKGRYMYVCI
jgi:hypothetical protein